MGGTSLKVLHTPGHTQDSICLYDGRNVFTGDTLFVDTIGKFAKADGELIFRRVSAIMQLPGSILMYPGHDYGGRPVEDASGGGSVEPFLIARDLRSILSLFS